MLASVAAFGAVDATVSPATVAPNTFAAVTVQVAGLAEGASVVVERYVDANGNGAVDADEFLVEYQVLTDGAVPLIDGVRNLNVPGDEDGAADGTITYRFIPRANAEIGRIAGAHLIRISSPTNAFAPFTRSLTLTQPATPHSVSGTITSDGQPVAHASVVLLQPVGDDDMEFAGGAIADAQGNFTIHTPVPGQFALFAVKPGYVSGFEMAAFVNVPAGETVADVELELLPATTSIAGRITFEGTNDGAPGVQLFAETESGYIVIATSGGDGSFSIPVVEEIWGILPSEISLARLGCIIPEDDVLAIADTHDGAIDGADFEIIRGNALIYGRVTDTNGNPISGFEVGANSPDHAYYVSTLTNTNGYYSLVVREGQWNFWFSENLANFLGYIIPAGGTLSLTADQALERNGTLAPVTAHITGTVTQSGAPRPGLRVGAFNSQTFSFASAITGADGSYSLGVTAGTWQVQLTPDSAAQENLISPNLTVTVEDGQTAQNTNLAVRFANASISGSVRDHNGDLILDGGVFATTTINGVQYNANASIINGTYSLTLFNSLWFVSVNIPGYPGFPMGMVELTADEHSEHNLTISFLPVIQGHPVLQNIQSGQMAFFNVVANSPLPVTFQWQMSTDGENWTNLTNGGAYGNVDTASLSVVTSDELNDTLYRCVVSNSAGSAISNAALLTVQSLATVPAFGAHPYDEYVVNGASTGFFASAFGNPQPALQWQMSHNGIDWLDVPENSTFSGTQTPSLQITNATLEMNGRFFRLRATNSAGAADSAWARLFVYETAHSWRVRKFTAEQLEDEQISGALATPAHDGIPNLLKYAFDLDPFIPAPGNALPQPYVDGGDLVLEFTALRTDLIYRVEASTDLVNWSDADVQLSNEGSFYRASYSLAGRPAAFLRIAVELLAVE